MSVPNARTATWILLSAIGLSCTGCMMTPGHGEHVGRKSAAVPFSGTLQSPNRWVCIQAQDRDLRWQTIGYARSGQTPIRYSGVDRYYWSNNLVVPHQFWHYLGSDSWTAEVRAIDASSGSAVPTFETDFMDYFDVNESMADLWEDHGHGSTATIYADT